MKKRNLVLGFMLIVGFAMSTNLMAQTPVAPTAGAGTELSPWEIANLNNLAWLQQSSNYANWDKYYIQTTDIDASATSTWNSGSGFSPIGSDIGGTNFTGTYDGDGHTINNLFINRSTTNYIGLFGYISNATIQNIGVTNIDITGGGYTGGLVGRNEESTVSNSYSTGSVSGTGSVGGLVGDNYNSSTVSNSYSTGSVSGTGSVGGLVGDNNCSSEVSNSYSTGIVSGNADVGGLVGKNFESTVSNSFWDTETSNQSISAGGTGKTTDEMTTDALVYNYTTNIYLHAGWDFKGESINGTDNIWNIGNDRNSGYPYLDWQYPSDPATLPVVLSTFTAQFIENTPTLYWTTQSETDNMGWFVYRNEENDFTTSEKISEFIEGYGTTTLQQSYIYEDSIENSEVGDKYYYWLESIDYNGMVNHYDKVAILTIPEQNDPGIGIIPEPEIFGLLQNEPNPFIESTKISFNLHETSQVELNIYNLKGQLVRSLYSGVDSSKTLAWNGKDDNGKTLSAGVYLYKLLVNGKTAETKKLILMK